MGESQFMLSRNCNYIFLNTFLAVFNNPAMFTYQTTSQCSMKSDNKYALQNQYVEILGYILGYGEKTLICASVA